jgi:hypothetical protein
MADAYKTLIQAAIPTTAAMIGSTPGVGKTWIMMHFSIRNTSGGTITVELFRNGTTAAYSWLGVISIGAGGHLEWDGTEALGASDYIAAVASNSGLYFHASGDEVT